VRPLAGNLSSEKHHFHHRGSRSRLLRADGADVDAGLVALEICNVYLAIHIGYRYRPGLLPVQPARLSEGIHYLNYV
jgi:hypothetical protein